MMEQVAVLAGQIMDRRHELQDVIASITQIQSLKQELSQLQLKHLNCSLATTKDGITIKKFQRWLTTLIQQSHNPKLVEVLQQYCHNNYILYNACDRPRSIFFPKENLPRPSTIYSAIRYGHPPITHMKSPPESFESVLTSIAECYGFTPNLETLLMHFPIYLKNYWQLSSYVTESITNPLPQVDVHIMAIMAVSAYGCLYLFERFAKKFLEEGGDPEWLQGKLPARIEMLKSLSCKLAYSPWSLLQEDFQPLLNYYSLKQIAHIVVLLSYHQCLACICMSNGIVPESSEHLEYVHLEGLKDQALWNFKKINNNPHEASCSKVLSMEQLAKELEEVQKKHPSESEEEQIRYSDTESPDYMKAIDKQMKSLNVYDRIKHSFCQFLDHSQKVERFDTGKYPYLECTELCFNPGVYVWLQEQDEKLADLVSNLVEQTKDMTNQVIGDKKDCSTIPLRQSIRFYYENLCGYHHQHYNYKQKVQPLVIQMTNFLSKELKFYIKVATIYPFLMEQSVLKNIPHQECVLSFFDTIHISLLSISTYTTYKDTKFELTMIMAIRSLRQLKR